MTKKNYCDENGKCTATSATAKKCDGHDPGNYGMMCVWRCPVSKRCYNRKMDGLIQSTDVESDGDE